MNRVKVSSSCSIELPKVSRLSRDDARDADSITKADYPPSLIHLFEEKLVSEFRWAGMTKITLQKPDFVNINEV